MVSKSVLGLFATVGHLQATAIMYRKAKASFGRDFEFLMRLSFS